MSTALLTVAQTCQMQAGTKDNAVWISPGFSGVCRAVTMKTYGEGKKMWPCTIADPDTADTIEVTFFTAPKFKEGDEVRFSGKGLRRTEYNGHPQAALGKDTVVEVSAGKPRVEAAAHAAVAEHANGAMISGAQVGMAMKAAIDLHTKHSVNGEQLASLLSAPGFWHDVYTTASDVIRVGKLLESGKLCDPVRTRANGHQPPPPPQAQPRIVAPARPAHDPERELDSEDTPF